MNRIASALYLAESFAENHGSLRRYTASYVSHRQNYGILDSMMLALEEQRLWDQFRQTLPVDFVAMHFG